MQSGGALAPAAPSDDDFLRAMEALWALRPPGPDNLYHADELLRLRDLAIARFGPPGSKDGLSSALSNALRSLGLPCVAPKGARSASPAEATERLLAAFEQRQGRRIHLCPLDMAGPVPLLDFGDVRLARLSTAELATLVDNERLKRWGHHFHFDADRLSQFDWLVVEDPYNHDVEPGARALPIFYSNFLDEDFGRIEPHQQANPAQFNHALFATILGRWEDCTETEVEWRPFIIRWVYTADDDLFARPAAGPSAGALTWEEWQTPDGDWIERPYTLSFREAARPKLLGDLTPEAWSQSHAALAHTLFEPPVEHFMVSAFQADGIDQFLHHITAIEAALGLPHDYPQRRTPKPGVRPKVTGRERVQHRIVGLLRDVSAGQAFERLFDLRSHFLHGRKMSDIPGADRVAVRVLARQVVQRLTQLATPAVTSREDFLETLLEQGLALCGRESRSETPTADKRNKNTVQKSSSGAPPTE